MKRHIRTPARVGAYPQTHCGLNYRDTDYGPFDADVYYIKRQTNNTSLCQKCRKIYNSKNP
jgi:hypothetical protein